jgi:hypothetical protein
MAVVKANYCKRGIHERQIAKANISYIQTRPGREKERLTRTLFGPTGALGRSEANQFITDAPKGTYFYRLKFSPDPRREDAKRDLPMQKLTRALMKRLEKRLKTAIPWAAALHDDHTDIRHIHILAALPRRLNTHELAFLIMEATRFCEQQRRFLDRGVAKLPWQEPEAAPLLKMGKYSSRTTVREHMMARPRWGRAPLSSCECPRCHMPQLHTRRQGSHLCSSCGLMLHRKKELRLQRKPRMERGLERSL